MILILSTPHDFDTQEVIDWLKYKKTDFFRLNDEDLINGTVEFNFDPINKKESYFLQNNIKIHIYDIKVVWFRKFGFLKSYEDKFGKDSGLVKYLYSELNILRSIIINLLEDKNWLFKKTNMPTKLKVLEVAYNCDLKIPKTLITSSKNELNKFLEKKQNSAISKSLGEGKNISYNGKIYPFFTKKVDVTDEFHDKFSPSFIQEYIEKKYELRIFYIDGEFYSMVIFSQNNPKTTTDFRNYDFEKPNRFEPYNLPYEVKKKLNKMMIKLGLNTGSIDMIKATNGEYYFLEVNPSGQFGMTSTPCNYNLYEKVANYLISKSI